MTDDTRPETDPTYELHLTAGDLPAGVTTPVVAERLDYYDAGVWATRSDGERLFVPYAQIRIIHERESRPETTEYTDVESMVEEREDDEE